MDETKTVRRVLVADINGHVLSLDKDAERTRLEEQYGHVWDTEELLSDFEVLSFMAPFTIIINRSTGKKGSLMFQDYPRFYFNEQYPDDPEPRVK